MYLMEGAQRRPSGTTNLHGVLALCSGDATTLISIVHGAKAVLANTILLHKSWRMSTLHFMMNWKELPWMPLASLPTKLGWNSTSGHRKHSLPTMMMFPLSELSEAFISVSKSGAMWQNFSFASRTIFTLGGCGERISALSRYSSRSHSSHGRPSPIEEWHEATRNLREIAPTRVRNGCSLDPVVPQKLVV